jgi:type IV pilus assembly protein PilF
MRVFSLFLLIGLIGCASSDKAKLDKKAELYYGHGTSSLMMKDYTTALEYLLKAAAIKPKNSPIHNNLGMAYFFKGESDLAKKHIRHALELDPKNADAKTNLASIFLHEKNFAEAEGLYNEILKDLIYPHQYRTYFNLGLLELERNNEPKAYEYFTKSIKVKQEYCPSYFQKGLIDFKNKKYKEALKNFKGSYQGTCYKNAAPHYYVALTLIELERFNHAREKLNYMLTKFAATEYDAKARVKLTEVDTLEQRSLFRTEQAKNAPKAQGNKFAPDF